METSDDPDFIGWIPTASERLSFSLIGDSDFPERAVTGYAKRDGRRFVVSYQRRETLDIPLPGRFLREFVAKQWLGRIGRCWYLCVGSTPENDELDSYFVGFLYLFIHKSDWLKVKGVVRKTQSDLENLALAPSAQTLPEKISSLQSLMAENANHSVQFELARTGTCKIWNHSAMLSANQIDKEDLAAQLFFFLKEISHVHQHHHEHSDRIVDLQKFDGEVSWRRETLCSLYRQSLRTKRNFSQSVASSAKVVVSNSVLIGMSRLNCCRIWVMTRVASSE